jgi:hypothetical protein
MNFKRALVAVLLLFVSIASLVLLTLPLVPINFIIVSQGSVVQVNQFVAFETSSIVKLSVSFSTVLSMSQRYRAQQIMTTTWTTTTYLTQSSTSTVSSKLPLVTSSSSTELEPAYELSNVYFGLLLTFVVLLFGSVGMLILHENPREEEKRETSPRVTTPFQRDDNIRATKPYGTDEATWREAEKQWREQYLKRERGRQPQNTRFCRYCGIEITGPDSYCEECGRRQSRSAIE